MIAVTIHSDGSGLLEDIPIDRISDVLQQENELLWVDVVDPTSDDLRLIGEEFNFHPLAMEDVRKHRQRPKVDFYEGYLFVVFYATSLKDRRVTINEVHLFIGRNYLVTVHDGSCSAITDTAARWRENVAQLGNRSISLLVYSLLDSIVDDYFPMIDDLSERIDELEERIFASFDQRALQEIFQLKKELLVVRRVLGPQRDVMNTLLRRDNPLIDTDTVAYFQDIYDHILRVTDAVDTYRDLLSSALDAYLSVTSNRLNRIMKTLTSSSIILMSMTLVAGIYGMNFVHIPELDWQLGYLWALGLMALIGSVIFVFFRRIDWL